MEDPSLSHAFHVFRLDARLVLSWIGGGGKRGVCIVCMMDGSNLFAPANWKMKPGKGCFTRALPYGMVRCVMNDDDDVADDPGKKKGNDETVHRVSPTFIDDAAEDMFLYGSTKMSALNLSSFLTSGLLQTQFFSSPFSLSNHYTPLSRSSSASPRPIPGNKPTSSLPGPAFHPCTRSTERYSLVGKR